MTAADLAPWTRLDGLLRCPRCCGPLGAAAAALACAGCGQTYQVEDGIARLFCPHDGPGASSLTERIRRFYERCPFPGYDGQDSIGSLIDKARREPFPRWLDEQIPPGALILDCGCGTGQLAAYLSLARRTVLAADLSLDSLRLGQRFKEANSLSGVYFLQMNLFRPALRPSSFDVVVCNGVLHHTSDPAGGLRTLAGLLKPGGYLVVGLYHKWGRLFTALRRRLYGLVGGRLGALDPRLRREALGQARRRAWLADQYENPHESSHTIGEAARWLEPAGLSFVKCLPRPGLGGGIGRHEDLFAAEAPPGRLALAQEPLLALTAGEGGLFVLIGRKPR